MAVGEHHDRQACQPEVETGTAIVEAEDQGMVLSRQTIDAEAAVGEVLEESSRGVGAEAAARATSGAASMMRVSRRTP